MGSAYLSSELRRHNAGWVQFGKSAPSPLMRGDNRDTNDEFGSDSIWDTW